MPTLLKPAALWHRLAVAPCRRYLYMYLIYSSVHNSNMSLCFVHHINMHTAPLFFYNLYCPP